MNNKAVTKPFQNICCGSEKVGKGRHGSSRRRYRSSEADDDDDYYDDEDDEGTCKDLHLPGRGSDCGRSAHLCDDPLWKELMTEQCPKTCNRCPGSRKRKRKTHHRRDSSESVVERKRKKGARAGSRSGKISIFICHFMSEKLILRL
jgi:hypothetical protein